MKVRDLVIVFVVIVLAVTAVRYAQFSHQVAQLKATADSMKAVADSVRDDAAVRVAHANARVIASNDSVAKLQAVAQRAQRHQQAAQRSADSAAAQLKLVTAPRDSIPLLVKEVVDLRSANTDLTLQLAEQRSISVTYLNRAIADEQDITKLNNQISGLAQQTDDLNAKIQKLHPPPTLVSQVFTWTTRALAAAKVIDIVTRH